VLSNKTTLLLSALLILESCALPGPALAWPFGAFLKAAGKVGTVGGKAAGGAAKGAAAANAVAGAGKATAAGALGAAAAHDMAVGTRAAVTAGTANTAVEAASGAALGSKAAAPVYKSVSPTSRAQKVVAPTTQVKTTSVSTAKTTKTVRTAKSSKIEKVLDAASNVVQNLSGSDDDDKKKQSLSPAPGRRGK